MRTITPTGFSGADAVTFGDAGDASAIEGMPSMLGSQQPDTLMDAGEYGPLTIRGASVRGASHRYEGTPRQDDFCLAVSPDGMWFVVVVADGVSAGPRSHVASRLVVRSGARMVADLLPSAGVTGLAWDEIIGRLAGQVLLQARRDTQNEALDARDAARIMATTVAFALVPTQRAPNGLRYCTVVAVGDTSVWALRGSGGWENLTGVKNAGEAVSSSATVALPLLPAEPVRPVTVPLAPGDVAFVVTDGVGDALGDGQGEVGTALAALWATPPARHQFTAHVDFARRSHADDRTAVGVWIEPGAAPPPPPAEAVGTEPASTARPTIAVPPSALDDLVESRSLSAPTPPEPTPSDDVAAPVPPEDAPAPTDAPAPADEESAPDGPPRVVDPIPALRPPIVPSVPSWEPTPWEPPAWSPPGSTDTSS